MALEQCADHYWFSFEEKVEQLVHFVIPAFQILASTWTLKNQRWKFLKDMADIVLLALWYFNITNSASPFKIQVCLGLFLSDKMLFVFLIFWVSVLGLEFNWCVSTLIILSKLSSLECLSSPFIIKWVWDSSDKLFECFRLKRAWVRLLSLDYDLLVLIVDDLNILCSLRCLGFFVFGLEKLL